MESKSGSFSWPSADEYVEYLAPTFMTCFLKGHCHGDFAVCWSKLLKYLTKNVFSDMKLT